ncbi:MAG: peptidoglycan-binding domain-containing protein [Chthoniobacterales bacterium]
MKHALVTVLAWVCLLPAGFCLAESDAFYDPGKDPLAPRDEYGLLHQGPRLNPTDFAPRHAFRFDYYFKSSDDLTRDPAYVGALQTILRNHGYYCGPIDGVFSIRVSEAIARMQKNDALHVTGTLTVSVRRTLHLP